MLKKSAPLLILLVTALVPLSMLARTLNPEYRDCMRQAVERYHSELIDIQVQYDQAYEQALEERKQELVASWEEEDDTAQRNRQRDADRAFSQRVSDARRTKSDRDRDNSRRFSDEKRECNRIPRTVSSASFSSFPRSTNSSFSRSSFPRTDTPPSGCGYIVCPNGKRFPKCTPEGWPINYFINPCGIR